MSSMSLDVRRPTKRARSDGAAVPAAKRSRPSTSNVVVRRRSAVLQPETKFFDTSFSFVAGGAADWTGTEVTCTNYIQSDGTTVGAYTDCALNPSAVGTGYGQVQGSKYLLRSIDLRGEVAAGIASDQADVANARSVRLVLVQDTMPQGAQAQGETVFTDMGTATQCNYSYLAQGAGAGGRFKILHEKVVLLQPISAGTDGTNTNSINWASAMFKMRWAPKRPIQVNIKASGSTPAVSQLSDCNIFLLAHASNTAPTATVIGAARCAFVD